MGSGTELPHPGDDEAGGWNDRDALAADLEASFAEEQARKVQRLLRLLALWTGAIVLVVWALPGVIPSESSIAREFGRSGARILGTLGAAELCFSAPFLPLSSSSVSAKYD